MLVFIIFFLYLKFLNLNATHTILCIGDSITYGSGSTNISVNSYPAILSQNLESKRSISKFQDFIIHSYGVRNACAQKIFGNSYWKTDEYRQSLTQINASIVIILLGSNDARYSSNWIENSFVNDYIELINTYKVLPNKPKIYLCVPPPLLPWYASTKVNSTIINIVYPQLIPQIAVKVNAEIIDVYRTLGGNGTTFLYPHYFVRDGIHPNNHGYVQLAKIVTEKLFNDSLQT